jgi:hypothetical protein
MGGDQKAFRILSQHAFDAEGLMKEVNSMELKVPEISVILILQK